MSDRPGSTAHVAGSNFSTTHWSLVLAAAEHPRPDGEAALATLCERYWYPLYAFVRRAGHDADEARDLTQAFFARVIEKGFLRAARPERGRFRTFLLACLKHFLANEWDRATTQKRGGGCVLSLDDFCEERYQRDPADFETPERLFERHWALTMLARALDALERDVAGEPASRLLSRVRPLLAGDGLGQSYRQVAEDLGMSEGAVKTGIHRLRGRFRHLLREEIAQTLGDGVDIESEIRFLLNAVGRAPSRV